MNWESLFLQMPVVAAFIWYTLEMNKRQQDSMQKRDEAYLNTLKTLTEKIERHDQNFSLAVTKMEERTRPINQRKKKAASETE